MLICANTLRTFTEAEINMETDRHWQDYFTGTPYLAVDGTLLVRFEPLGVKVFFDPE